MAGKGKRAKKGKKAGRAKRATPKKAPAKKGTARAGTPNYKALINTGMHDFTNLATAVRAYLELLSSQGALDEKQKYYVARAREQVEMMVDLVRELKDKLI
jgi:hypothetical protein